MSQEHWNTAEESQPDGVSPAGTPESALAADAAPADAAPAAGARGSRARRARLSTRSRIAVMALATVAAVGMSTAVFASASEGSALDVLNLDALQTREKQSQPRDGDAKIDPDKANIKGEKVYRNLSRGHTEGRADYSGGPMPPVGGEHNPTWQNADGDVYTEPLRNEHAVHTLEHGAVWATYSRDATAADVKALKAKVEGVPYRFMSPVPEQDAPVKVTAWGHQLSLRSADDPRVDAFFDAYVQGPQTPEQGAPITGGRTAP